MLRKRERDVDVKGKLKGRWNDISERKKENLKKKKSLSRLQQRFFSK